MPQTQEKTHDLVEMFNTFQRTVLEKKPSFTQMYNDVRMMDFKIRPLRGDLSALDFNNFQFVETLWSLGKLDEFYQKKIQNISEKQRTIFYRLFDEMYETYHSELNQIHIKSEDTRRYTSLGFELEIFRENKEYQVN